MILQEIAALHKRYFHELKDRQRNKGSSFQRKKPQNKQTAQICKSGIGDCLQNFFLCLFSHSSLCIIFCHRKRTGIKILSLVAQKFQYKNSFCPGNDHGLAGGSLYKRTGNIYEQFEGFLVNIHLDKVDVQALHSLSLSLIPGSVI